MIDKDFDRIVALIEKYTEWTRADIVSKRRTEQCYRPRFLVMYFLKYLGHRYTEISALMGWHHSTVINAVQKVRRDIKLYEADRLTAKTIEEGLKGSELVVVPKDYLENLHRRLGIVEGPSILIGN